MCYVFSVICTVLFVLSTSTKLVVGLLDRVYFFSQSVSLTQYMAFSVRLYHLTKLMSNIDTDTNTETDTITDANTNITDIDTIDTHYLY